jgi:transposase
MTTATVLSGPERRRRWTRAEKALIVEESLCGGSVAEVARRHDVHANLLHAWRRQARTGTLVGGRNVRMMPASDFAPVVIASDGGVPRAARSDAGAGDAVIELVLRNGRVLRVPEDAAPARVAALADVLEGSGS